MSGSSDGCKGISKKPARLSSLNKAASHDLCHGACRSCSNNAEFPQRTSSCGANHRTSRIRFYEQKQRGNVDTVPYVWARKLGFTKDFADRRVHDSSDLRHVSVVFRGSTSSLSSHLPSFDDTTSSAAIGSVLIRLLASVRMIVTSPAETVWYRRQYSDPKEVTPLYHRV